MNHPGSSVGLRRPGARTEQGSQTATEALLLIYAIVASLVLIRTMYLTAGILDSLWAGGFIYTVTDLLVLPLTIIPGGGVEIVNLLTLADLALSGLTFSIPFVLLAMGRNRHS